MVPRSDPSLIALAMEMSTPELEAAYLRRWNLLPPAGQPVGVNRNGNPYLALCSSKPFNLKKPNCTGKIKEVMLNGSPHFRCTVCRNSKSAHHGPSAYDPTIQQSGLPIFNVRDVTGRPNRKVDPRDIVYVVFMLSKEYSLSRMQELVGRQLSKEARVEWSLQIRQFMMNGLADAPKVGGVGDIVEIDETYMKGRRKSNRGRYLQGNRVGHQGHRRNNYLARSQGPWLFGLICRRTQECRVFWVPDRTAATLMPILKRHVAPGTLIYSDEWRAYCQISSHGFHHDSVNHSLNFINPVTGCHTQSIERQWRTLKQALLKLSPGVRARTLPSKFALHWWLSFNGRQVCEESFLRLLELVSKHHVP